MTRTSSLSKRPREGCTDSYETLETLDVVALRKLALKEGDFRDDRSPASCATKRDALSLV